VPGVGEQGEAAGQQAADDLGDGEGAGQGEGDPQRPGAGGPLARPRPGV
jgi:hypothetical protein